jgi:hypothetical protein
LLNQRNDVEASHEPINPGAMSQALIAGEAVDSIAIQVTQLELSIEQGLPFAHGDKGGLTIDNP